MVMGRAMNTEPMGTDIETFEVSDYICLAAMYPSDGIIGCLEAPIKDMELPHSFIREVGESAHLSELKRLTGRAAKWFLPGDIVVRYPAVSELGCDVFRQKQDVVMVHARACAGTDWDAVERLRANCIEQHQWDFDREGHQFTLCDPFGRVVAITWAGMPSRPAKGGRIPFKYVANRLDDSVSVGKGSPHAKMDAWSVLKRVHAYMLEHGADWDAYHRITKASEDMFRIRNKIGYLAGKRLFIKRNPSSSVQMGCKDYWKRVNTDDSVPKALRKINTLSSKERYTYTVKLTESDLRDVLETCTWPEYRPNIHPWIFAVDTGGRRARNWLTIRAR